MTDVPDSLKSNKSRGGENSPPRPTSLVLSEDDDNIGQRDCSRSSGYTTPDANVSLDAVVDEDESNTFLRSEADVNPFRKSLRRQSAVEVPRTPQVEVKSPVADRHAENYNMNFSRRGVALILNHVNFDHEEERKGSDKDCVNLNSVLQKLGFETRVKHDLKRDAVMDQLKMLSEEDHSDADCVLIAVLSHGFKGELYAKDETYNIEKLWSYFTADRCASLAGKPKIFILQACRGSKVEGATIVADTVDAPKGRRFYTIPNHADILVANATADGYYAWRNPESGSWFIQILCEELVKHADNRDLVTILTFVSRRVAVECESQVPGNQRMNEKKQIPCMINML